ncbi:recombination protein O N-terminal domain-containing protein [Candidatus Kaiserbacteria bacterium]|nr:MAG: recombination protein O N-terminal domain-containing protein [Candidatus Kaiserbacteria bacterium]
MAYKTYITEALVCESIDSQTSDRSFLLFTREAGMVYAHAQSVREERSKHRYSLQECAHARVTLVRGKAGWRVTGAEPLHNFYSLAHTREARAFVRNIVLLIRRIMQGETAHEKVFDEVVYACMHLEQHIPSKLECILSLRILHALGYIASEASIGAYLDSPFASLDSNSLLVDTEKHCNTLITQALLESHL